MVSVWPLARHKSEDIAQEYRSVLPDFQSAGCVLLQLVWPLELCMGKEFPVPDWT